MKKFVLFLILNSQFLIFNSFSQSPDWLWAKSMGGITYDYGNSVAIDGSGNVYTTGSFAGTVDFDPGVGTFNLTAIGNWDIFISKLDSSGNFVWAKAMVGTEYEEALSITLVPAGNGAIYTTGWFRGTVDFDPGAGIFNLTAAMEDIFISKLDTSGNFVWAKAIGGAAGGGNGNSIAIDPAGSGDVYTTGTLVGTADFDPGVGTFNLTSAGSYDMFISKLDSSGNFVWAKALSSINNVVGYSIAIDSAGSGAVYTTGYFQGTADFDPGAGVFNVTVVGDGDIFVSKLDTAGNFIWAKTIGEPGGFNVGIAIALDLAGSGDVYTTGHFFGTVDFNPGAATFNLSAHGNVYQDIFILKLNSSGNFVWAKAMGGTSDDSGRSIAIDPAGSGAIYTTGHCGPADFDPGPGVYNLTGGNAFISKIDSSGNFVWAKAMRDQGNSITLGASGNVYVTGIFGSPSVTFGPTILTNAGGNNGTPDLFIAKLDTAITTGINPVSESLHMTNIYPNPLSNSTTISFFLSQPQKISLKIFDVNGRLVAILANKMFEAGENEIVWNAVEVNAGIYFLQVQIAEITKTEKLIVMK